MGTGGRHSSDGAPRVLRGATELGDLTSLAVRAACRSVALVADGAVVANGYAERLGTLLDRALHTVVHVVPPGEPTVSSVDACAAALADLDAPLVIGLGGGSALDTAKQVAVLLAYPGRQAVGGIGPYLLGNEPLPGRRPLVAIPTTSGTGAEVTRTCVLADDRPGGDGRKVWTWGDALLPDVVVLDPEATVTMPATVTTGTGLDAFVHAVEAVTGQRRDERSPEPALRALELVRAHLPKAVADGTDLRARAAMQEAAYLAGTAIDGCGTGMAHAIGHALGSLYHVPHGLAVAIGLEVALAWNIEGERAAFGAVSAALAVDVDALPACYRALWAGSGLPAAVATLPDTVMDTAAVAAAMVADENLPMVRNNCRRSTDDDVRELAGRAVVAWAALRARTGAAR